MYLIAKALPDVKDFYRYCGMTVAQCANLPSSLFFVDTQLVNCYFI